MKLKENILLIFVIICLGACSSIKTVSQKSDTQLNTYTDGDISYKNQFRFKSMFLESQRLEALEEFDIKEDVDFKISNIEGFDYQINNLVKHQKNKEVRENIKKFEKILANNKIVDNFEITKNYFINMFLKN